MDSVNNRISTSIIIPTYNKRSRLIVTLESIKRLKLSNRLEVIIVNDGSDDDTQDILDKFHGEMIHTEKIRVKILKIENSGRSVARNRGIEVANGELIIFSDDDLILDNMFVLWHEEMHRNYKNAVIHGKINSLPYLKFFISPMSPELVDGGQAIGLLKNKVIKLNMFQNGVLEKYLKENARVSKFEKDIKDLFDCTNVTESIFRWIGFTGGNVSVQKHFLNEVGQFDPCMGKEWGCEDIELGYRLFQYGLNFYYCENAINYHMNHYRKDFLEIHNSSFQYFEDKYEDYAIHMLKEYFNGRTNTLVDWMNQVLLKRESVN